ncbi:hypothetical protein GCM10028803_30700 [Larkinella knui]|uniref:Response regulator n=1 Tax=Larkinella knui TaxID=2025310 RepID=A0A3P1CXQ1_9BACT|nr:response regulator [Larkinella knui]RRB18095.1 response regulator [Larkinella knui]
MKPNPNAQTTDWIVVVENGTESWMNLQAAFGKLEPKIETVHASNGTTALSYLETCLLEQETLPRLILTNLYLPMREDGLRFLSALQDNASFCVLPVVVLSASDDPADRQEAHRRGASYRVIPTDPGKWDDFLRSIPLRWNEGAARK